MPFQPSSHAVSAGARGAERLPATVYCLLPGLNYLSIGEKP